MKALQLHQQQRRSAWEDWKPIRPGAPIYQVDQGVCETVATLASRIKTIENSGIKEQREI